MTFTAIPGPSSPVVFHVPHAGVTVPADLEPFPSLGDLDAEVRLMADLHTHLIADAAASALADADAEPPAQLRNDLSRVVMDPERFDDESETMNAVGMGVIYTRTHDGAPLYATPPDAAEVRRRTDAWYRPYGAALTAMVDDAVERHGRALIVDIHSYATAALPYELHGDGPRPPVCLGFEEPHARPATVSAFTRLLREHGYEVFENSPFIGSYVPTNRYGTDPRVESVMFEIRKDQYLTGPTSAPEPDAARVARLGEAIAACVRSWLSAAPVG